MPIGLSFSPMGKDHQAQQAPGQGQTPIQDAIKVLSLQLPRFVGTHGLAPNSLMQSVGAAGLPGMGMPGGLEQWIRQLFGHLLPGMGPGSLPPPQIEPGALPGDQPQMPAPPNPSMPGRSAPPTLGNPPIEVPPYGRGNPMGGGTEWWGGKPSLPEPPRVAGRQAR